MHQNGWRGVLALAVAWTLFFLGYRWWQRRRLRPGHRIGHPALDRNRGGWFIEYIDCGGGSHTSVSFARCDCHPLCSTVYGYENYHLITADSYAELKREFAEIGLVLEPPKKREVARAAPTGHAFRDYPEEDTP